MSGLLRHRVTLESRTNALDSYGEDVPTWTEIAKAYAQIVAVTGRERFEAQQVQSDVTHRIIIRYNSVVATLVPADRIVYGSRTFDIVGVWDKDGRSRYITLLVLERA